MTCINERNIYRGRWEQLGLDSESVELLKGTAQAPAGGPCVGVLRNWNLKVHRSDTCSYRVLIDPVPCLVSFISRIVRLVYSAFQSAVYELCRVPILWNSLPRLLLNPQLLILPLKTMLPLSGLLRCLR